MKIKEGGGMELQKERELCGLEFEKEWDSFCEAYGNGYNKGVAKYFFFEAWQAKAQAVPDLGELQERIAGHQYYHDEHGHMIVDMDDVVKEISGFDSWKAQAVPEVTDKMIVAIESEVENQLKASAIDSDPFRLDGEKIWYAALEAQEPAND